MKNIKIFLLLHLLLAVYALLGVFSKLAAHEQFLSLKFILFYGIVLVNLFLYAIFWQQIIKRLPLITAYANKAITVIWGILFGFLFFRESVTVQKVIGAVIIVAGIYLVVSSAEEKVEEQ